MALKISSRLGVDVSRSDPPACVSQKAWRRSTPISTAFSFSLHSSRRRGSLCASRGLPSTPFSSPSPPPNLDDDGATVQDMELFLNNLSLEYESVWDTKPAWCQPWTIVLTGCIAVLISWFTVHSVIATALVTAAIGAWWYIFLYSYPQAYAEMIAARRQRISEGDEDTYGSKRLVKWNFTWLLPKLFGNRSKVLPQDCTTTPMSSCKFCVIFCYTWPWAYFV